MIRGFYTAASSLVAQQNNLDIIANNVANANTVGFKPQHAAFSSLLHQQINGGAANPISAGHGVRIEKTSTDLTQGHLLDTQMPYDFAILGEGFFAVEGQKAGSISYTRDGGFKVTMDGKKAYLTDSEGNFVLDSAKKRIEIGEKFNSSQIGVFKFANPYGLEFTSGNKFSPTDASGSAEVIKNPVVKAGYLENSAVEISLEMVKMIEASKGFSFGSRVVQTADEMEKTINQLR
jgi:flagellar basal body rod protein FlgG